MVSVIAFSCTDFAAFQEALEAHRSQPYCLRSSLWHVLVPTAGADVCKPMSPHANVSERRRPALQADLLGINRSTRQICVQGYLRDSRSQDNVRHL